MAIASLLLAAIAVLGWWALHAQRESMLEARDQQVQTIGTLLSQNAESLLSQGELSTVRRLLIDSARTWRLRECRIIVGDHLVLADAEPQKINLRALPVVWPLARHVGRVDPTQPGAADIEDVHSYPITIAGHGSARLDLAAAPEDAGQGHWNTQLGISIVGAATLSVFLLLYRRLRWRLRGTWVVREALLEAGSGNRSSERLIVDESFGAEARAWNRVILEAKTARRHVIPGAGAPPGSSVRVTGAADLEAACDVMANGLVLLDAHQRVKFANGAASIYLKAKREEIIGREIATIIHDRPVLDAVDSIIRGAAQGMLTLEVKDGGSASATESTSASSGVLRISVRPVRKRDGAAAMLVIEDVTQQRVADEARNSFVAQAAHELRTPLTNIRLYVETAIEDGAKDPAIRENCLNVISQESLRLERIVGEMLSVSEIEAGSIRIRKDDVRMDALLEQIQAEFRGQAAEKKIAFEFNVPPKLPVLQGDRDKIALALHNLVGNAIKYTLEGGRVSITAERRGALLAIEVADSGIGIKPEELELVFQKFYRARDARVGSITGTGLGLTLAREVARLHGGNVIVQSQLDKGSTFTLTLPAPADE